MVGPVDLLAVDHENVLLVAISGSPQGLQPERTGVGVVGSKQPPSRWRQARPDAVGAVN
jgi:hypothetical protein